MGEQKNKAEQSHYPTSTKSLWGGLKIRFDSAVQSRLFARKLVLVTAVMVFSVALSLPFYTPSKVEGGNAGGSGGSGNGGAGGAQAVYGYGWYKFSTTNNSLWPKGFRNAQTYNGSPLSWSGAAKVCNDLGADSIIAFVINADTSYLGIVPKYLKANSVVYDYVGWNNSNNYYNKNVSSGRYLSIADAKSAFSSSGVTGLTWGSTAAWFCSDYNSDWALSGDTKASTATVEPGQSVTFTSSIKNTGTTTTASFEYGPRYFYSDTASPTRTGTQSYTGESSGSISGNISNVSTTLASGKSVTDIKQTVTVASTKQYICGTVAFDKADSKGTRNGRSTPDCVAIGYKPYFTTTGGDMYSQGSITSWNTNGGTYDGAGSQLAALATGNITSFITGSSGVSGGSSSVGFGSKLAFANTTVGGSTYGGGYTVTPPQPPNPTGGSWSGLSSPSGVYSSNSTVTLSGTLTKNKNLTLVISAGYNLYISGNIGYSYSDISEIPRLTVILKGGNIYVNKDVTEIHGVFNASGNFYSCATGPSTAVTLSKDTYTTCNKKLNVYGSVTANELVLSRTYGSVHASGTVPAKPAENFIYSPEVWLAPSANTNGLRDVGWSSYVSLPPIL